MRDWQTRFLLRFGYPPSQKLTEYINYEISLAIQRYKFGLPVEGKIKPPVW